MSSDQTGSVVRMDDRAMRRAAAWLASRGAAGIAPSPLLAARLRVRRRIVIAMFGVVVLVGLVAVATYGRLGWDSYQSYQRGVVARLLGNMVFVLVVVLARWLALRAVRRADRRIGAALSRRVAHPTPFGWRAVLGRRLAIPALTFGGAVGIGVAAAVLARTTQDLMMVAVLLLGVAVLAAMTAVEIAEILRRPALAEDAASLAADDALRIDDARGVATSPLPVLLAALTATSLTPSAASSLTGFSFAFIGLFLVATVWDQTVSPTSAIPGGSTPATTS
jgi:hypothetical protein